MLDLTINKQKRARSIYFAGRGHQQIIEVIILIKITGESVKFIGSKQIKDMSLKLYLLYRNKHSHFITFHLFITISQHLEFKFKIQHDPYYKSQLLLKSLYLEVTLTFLRFAAKHCSIAHLFGGSYQLYAAICCIFQTLQREIV